MKITVYNQQKNLPLSKSSARNAIAAALKFLKMDWEQITLYFVTEKRISSLHEQFFDDPTSTDCITFPIDDRHGEIFVCPATAIAYAEKRKQDPYWEATLYIVHALLHLAGYDDLEEKAKRSMRKKEKSCMGHLSKLGLLISQKP